MKKESKGKNFSWDNFAKLIVKRQEQKDAGTIIIIYGFPRTGKTTLGFDILIPFLKIMRWMFRKKRSNWSVPNRWSWLFKDYFSGDASDMMDKIKKNPERSFSFVDEGVDIFSWQHMLEKEQKNLIELLLKTSKKKALTIIVTPSLKLLRSEILYLAHYLFIITSEPTKKGNYAFYFRNYDNPILREENPFGIKSIKKAIVRYRSLARKDRFEIYLKRQPRCMGICRFHKIDDKLYGLYDRLVKEPLIEGMKKKIRTVSYAKYGKLRYTLDTILYNLYVRDNKKITQIHRLTIDKFGSPLISQGTIKFHVDKIMAIEKKPKMDDEEAIKTEKEVKVTKEEDIKV